MTYVLAMMMWLSVLAPVPVHPDRQQRPSSGRSAPSRPIYMHTLE
jgi:hypothetical protein